MIRIATCSWVPLKSLLLLLPAFQPILNFLEEAIACSRGTTKGTQNTLGLLEQTGKDGIEMWEAELQLSKRHETTHTTPVSSQLDTPQESETIELEPGRGVKVLWDKKKKGLRNYDRKSTQRITGNLPVLSRQPIFESNIHIN